MIEPTEPDGRTARDFDLHGQWTEEGFGLARRGLNLVELTRPITQFQLSSPTIMSTPTTSRGSSISQYFRAIKKIIQDETSGARYVWSWDRVALVDPKFEPAGPLWH